MGVEWCNKENLISEMIKHLDSSDSVLDIGSGICPRRYLNPLVYICCEPFDGYIKVLQDKLKKRKNHIYITIKATWEEVIERFCLNSIDTIFILDVIEHIEKEKALNLLEKTLKIAKKQVVIFTPLGFLPQEHNNEKDAWGLEGGEWQKHRSGWIPEDFDDTWQIVACREYHSSGSKGEKLKEPAGVFFAIKKMDYNDKGTKKIRILRFINNFIDRFIEFIYPGYAINNGFFDKNIK